MGVWGQVGGEVGWGVVWVCEVRWWCGGVGSGWR